MRKLICIALYLSPFFARPQTPNHIELIKFEVDYFTEKYFSLREGFDHYSDFIFNNSFDLDLFNKEVQAVKAAGIRIDVDELKFNEDGKLESLMIDVRAGICAAGRMSHRLTNNRNFGVRAFYRKGNIDGLYVGYLN